MEKETQLQPNLGINGEVIDSGIGIKWPRLFGSGHPYDSIKWEKRTAKIAKGDGTVVFEQKDIEVPSFWTQTATDIVASKYFRGKLDAPERETSVRQMVDRVAKTIGEWGMKDGYFETIGDCDNFTKDLTYLLVNQQAAFNSPVWFNVGVHEKAQCSACFILSVEDNMQSILDWYRDEGWIFKFGSGSGINLSKLRSSKEPLSKGGYSSGPVSFMKGADGVANSIRSGGTTRRAAKMVVLNADHPDIKEFIDSKKIIEDMTKALALAGFKDSIAADLFDPYTLLPYQNANNSVRVTDAFMRAVEADGYWDLKAVTTGETIETVKAKDLLRKMAEAAWHSADPGIQYDTTINEWHTLPNAGPITASNPCSEYMSIDNSACLGPEVRISTKRGLIPVSELYKRQQNGETIYIKTELLSENAAVPRRGKRGYCPADVYARQIAFRPAAVLKTGRKQLYKIKLSTDQTIRLTADHKVLTEEGWKEVGDLIIGKDAIVTQKQSSPLDYSEASQEEIDRYQMLGWMIGDGYISRNGKKPAFGLVFGPEDYKAAQYLKPIFNELVSQYTQAPWKNVGLSVQSNGVMQMGSTAGHAFQHLVSQYGVHPGVAPEKKVPASVFEAPKVLQAAFLGALFSADGTIYVRGIDNWSNKNDTPNLLVRLTSTSPKLLNDAQVLLFDFGIRSSITWTHPDGRKNPQGTLSIYGHHAYKFCQLVGFPLSEKKQAKALRVVSEPFQGNSFVGRRATVEEITKDEIDDVYDISEPITHSMIAEGMIIHNCNLASLNLMKFLREGGRFDVDAFKKAVDTMILAQDILVDRASYPTEKIENNAHAYRQLGLGYANLGSLLMLLGLPYDSDKGRTLAGQITSLMSGEAYRMSAVIASHKGPFAGYHGDREGMLGVLGKHRDEADRLFEESQQQGANDSYLETASRMVWHETKDLADEYGVKNSQISVLAPTGTISFLMDCDTTGIEPELALVKYKKLVGGGTLKLVNNQVPIALRRLGYLNEEVEEISKYILEKETIEGAPYLKEEHLPIFDCSFKAPNGSRSISYMGHIGMMAAAQPFISGAISKTINLPSDATIEDIEDVFFRGWRLGLKALAVYRDGCKSIQPLNTSDDTKHTEPEQARYGAGKTRNTNQELVEKVNGYTRIKLPDERPSITHKFSVGGFESYLTVGFYPDTMKPGETFITTAKEGSTLSGLFDTIATLVSICLQSGIPLKALVKKFKDLRFEPAGFTTNPDIPVAKSVVDYVFRYLGMKYLSPEDREEVFGRPSAEVEPLGVERQSQGDKILAELALSKPGPVSASQQQVNFGSGTTGNGKAHSLNADAPLCNNCGTIMIHAGSCYSCPNCFATTGVCN